MKNSCIQKKVNELNQSIIEHITNALNDFLIWEIPRRNRLSCSFNEGWI